MKKIAFTVTLTLFLGCTPLVSSYSAGPRSVVLLSVGLSPLAQNNLKFLYDHAQRGSQGTEFSFCAYGTVGETVVNIEYIVLAHIEESTPTSVRSDRTKCPPGNLLGMGHSHSAEYLCEFSEADLAVFRQRGDQYAFLYCAGEQIKVYTRREIPNIVSFPSAPRDTTQVWTPSS